MSSQGTFTEASVDYDLKGVIESLKLSVLAQVGEKDSIGSLREKTKKFTGPGYTPAEQGKISVGIVGAGVAGLFAALRFDWLNCHDELKGKGLNISYDILEAAGAERLGGHLYTHRFSDEEHDYYDVGAMRFQNNTIMKTSASLMRQTGKALADTLPRTFQLFQTLRKKADDPYDVNKGLPENSQIPPELLKTNPSDLVSAALKVFTGVAKEKFKAAIAEEEEGEKQAFKSAGKDEKRGVRGPASQELWDLLMRADHMSVRQFLGSGQKKEIGKGPRLPVEDDFPLGPGYNYNTIEWLETTTYGTGWYGQSLTECVLEELYFHTPDMDDDPTTKDIQYWWCIDGGAQEIAKRMAMKVRERIEYNTKVQSIDAQVQLRRERKAGQYTPMKIKTTITDPKTKKVETKDREYFAIFNSTTLAALQRMELSDAGLSWVGMKFRTAWWQTDPFNIAKCGVSRTDLSLRVCVYPSYNMKSNEGEDKWDPEKPAVLLCSYTWGQDAQRIGSLCSNNTTQDDAELKLLIIHDPARLHGRKERQLYLVGEAASSHHAWIVGALESVIRAVYVMFQGLQNGNEKFEAYDIVLKLLRTGPDNGKNVSQPLKKNGDMPTGLPFHPLPEEMPTRQFHRTKDKDLTASTEKEANEEGVDMTYGAALAVLSLIESFYELGVDKNDTY
ncbi:hypothetical protein LZL87_009098 [Fusarium oxysporum]|nr:hypothetical protein LZL87_009098 [Fusarium oxysporum]